MPGHDWRDMKILKRTFDDGSIKYLCNTGSKFFWGELDDLLHTEEDMEDLKGFIERYLEGYPVGVNLEIVDHDV